MAKRFVSLRCPSSSMVREQEVLYDVGRSSLCDKADEELTELRPIAGGPMLLAGPRSLGTF